MRCQGCGVEAQTKYVEFHQNIGVVVVRFSKSIEANLCKSCIHRAFWRLTPTTLVLGWWGVQSCIFNTCYVLNNVGRYIPCLFMRSAPPRPKRPQLTEQVINRLQPHTEELMRRIGQGESIDQVTEAIAKRTGSEPGEVALYIYTIAQAARGKAA